MEERESRSSSFLLSLMAGLYFAVLHLLLLLHGGSGDPGIIFEIQLWFSPLLFLLSAFFWWLFIERRRKADWVRGGLVGMFSGIIHYFIMGLIMGIPSWGAYMVVLWFFALLLVPLLVLAGVIAAIGRKRLVNSQLS